MLTVVDAKNTPLVSMIPKATQLHDSLLMEWPTDGNEAPGDSSVVDNADVETYDNALSAYAVLSGRLQWNRRAAQVSKLAQEAQNQAGIKDKEAKAIAKKLVQLKRDMEIRIGGDGEARVGTGALSNRTRGMGVWIQATAQSLYPVDAAYRTPTGSISTTATASITDATLQGVLTSQYLQCGEKKTWTTVCGSTFKGVFRSLQQTQFGSTNVASSIRTYSQDGASKKIVSTVDIYTGDHGTMELIDSLWLGYADDGSNVAATTACRAYNLDMDRWALVHKQRPQVGPRLDFGGGGRYWVDTIWGLKCWSPLDSAKFASTS